MEDQPQPNFVEMAPLPIEEDDDDVAVSVAPPSQPENRAAPQQPQQQQPQQQLRPEAKPFTPLPASQQGDSMYLQDMQQQQQQQHEYDDYAYHQLHHHHQRLRQNPARQVSVTRAHYDEDGNVVYPARVTVVQNPAVVHQIAQRDLAKGFRENSKKTASYNAQQQLAAQQQPHVWVQTPGGPVMMPAFAPPAPMPAHQLQQHQPAFAVFNRHQQPLQQQQRPSAPAQPAPLGGAGAGFPLPPAAIASLPQGPGNARPQSLAAALVDPLMNPPPKYSTYNPFADTTLDTVKSSLDTLLDDDDDADTTRDSVDAAGSAEVDPLWLLTQVKKLEEDNNDPNNNSAAAPRAVIAASALLGLPQPVSVAHHASTTSQLLHADATPEPIGPKPGGFGSVGLSASHPMQPPAYAGAIEQPAHHFSTSAALPPPYTPQPAGQAAPINATATPPTPTPSTPCAPAPAGSTFVPNPSARPYAPNNLPTYQDAMDLPSAPIQLSHHRSNPSSVNTTLHSDGSPGPRHDDSMEDTSREEGEAMSNLRINPDAFFAPSNGAGQPSNAFAPTGGNPRQQQANPFSLQSLQGVRRAEHAIPLQQVVWQRVYFGGSETWVPPVFPTISDELVRLHNGSKHYDVSRPLSHPNVTLHLYNYQCQTCTLDHIYPGKVLDRPADVKLGGICGDIPALCIAHMIEVITGVRIVAIDMFGNNLGRCNLWLYNPLDVRELIRKFDRKMWMSPVYHQYAVVATDDDGKEFLHWYLEGLRAYGPKSVRFPRHLVTCEKWIA